MKYKFRLMSKKTTLAFSNSEETLRRIADLLELPDSQITSTKNGLRETIWAGARTPIEIGSKE